jgi:cyclophilin family peptidyl-prolyl cis-trans isomerase
MAKKREKIRRRREVTRARQGAERPERKPSRPPVARQEEKTTMKDVWIALGIVGGIVVLFVLLYQFAVRQPPSRAEPEPTPATPETMSWEQPPAMALDTAKSYEAVLHTEKGDVRLELHDDLAPMTVNNFVFLAREGFYDGVTFHRVIPGFMAQTGDPTGTGSGGPGYRFDDEFDPSLRHDAAGVVSMANGGPNTNGSQFFVTYGPASHLDDEHTIFGRVIEGMDVVESLTPRNPLEDPDAPPGDRILSVDIVES